ncbi:MAG: hypothetical protein ACRD3C_17680 [Vicinamibacterales bacterium]
MNAPLRLLSILSIALAASAASLYAAEQSGKRAFVSAWEDRTVVLKQALYSLVFDERKRFLPIVKRQGRVSGLTVATSSGMYYQFDARRDSEGDIVERDPSRIVTTLQEQYYRGRHLDIGPAQDVETLMLVRYEPGVELIVRSVQIERDRVRLFLHKDHNADLATTLTVKWPVPLSKELTESSLIDDVLTRFVARE